MKHRIRQMIKEAIERAGLEGHGQTLEEIMMNGIPSGALGVNMSKSVQINTPLPIQIMLDTEHTSEVAGGAIGGLAVSAGRAVTSAARGDWERVGENITPNAVGNIIRGIRLYRDGATTGRGRPIMDEAGQQIKATGMEAAERMAGFMPTRLAARSEANRTKYNLKDYWNGERDNLITRFVNSFDNKVKNDKVIDEIEKFNDRLIDDKEAILIVSPITSQSLRGAVSVPHGKGAMKDAAFMEQMVK
jgi:hypothetical protein